MMKFNMRAGRMWPHTASAKRQRKVIIAHDSVYFGLRPLLNIRVQNHDEDKRRQRSGCLRDWLLDGTGWTDGGITNSVGSSAVKGASTAFNDVLFVVI